MTGCVLVNSCINTLWLEQQFNQINPCLQFCLLPNIDNAVSCQGNIVLKYDTPPLPLQQTQYTQNIGFQ